MSVMGLKKEFVYGWVGGWSELCLVFVWIVETNGLYSGVDQTKLK